MATAPTYKKPEGYTSEYQPQIDKGIEKVINRETFSYDPLKDANYQSMAKLYQKQGEQAAKNTMADAATLNGGFGSSYAVTASQQARNDYNQQLASQIPALQEAAYNKYVQDYNMDLSALGVLQDADNDAYGRYRDSVSDAQWEHGQAYQAHRDDVADTQWQKNYNRSVYESDRDYKYQKSRDKVSDSQWKQSFDYQKSRDKVSDSQWLKEYTLSKKSATSSGGGSSSRGGNTYVASGGSGSGNGFEELWNDSNSGSDKGSVSSRALRNAKAKEANKGKTAKKSSGSSDASLFKSWQKNKKNKKK